MFWVSRILARARQTGEACCQIVREGLRAAEDCRTPKRSARSGDVRKSANPAAAHTRQPKRRLTARAKVTAPAMIQVASKAWFAEGAALVGRWRSRAAFGVRRFAAAFRTGWSVCPTQSGAEAPQSRRSALSRTLALSDVRISVGLRLTRMRGCGRLRQSSGALALRLEQGCAAQKLDSLTTDFRKSINLSLAVVKISVPRLSRMVFHEWSCLGF